MTCCNTYDQVADYRIFEYRGRTYQFRNRNKPCQCGAGHVQEPGIEVWVKDPRTMGDRYTSEWLPSLGYWTLWAYFRNVSDAKMFCRGRWKAIKHRPHDTRMPGDLGRAEVEPDGHGRPAHRSEWR